MQSIALRWVAAACVLALLVAPARAERCGVERAAVKLGLDAEATAVRMVPRDTTVAELVALVAPRRPTRRAAAELTTWRIRVTITAYKRERDGDYHVVVADDTGQRMIVELPSPTCAAAGAWAAQVATAREVLDRELAARRPSGRLRSVVIRDVTIVGVGFFDLVHGQDGVAPNGIELHPVLAIRIGGDHAGE